VGKPIYFKLLCRIERNKYLIPSKSKIGIAVIGNICSSKTHKIGTISKQNKSTIRYFCSHFLVMAFVTINATIRFGKKAHKTL
jgi:hypothetical protein